MPPPLDVLLITADQWRGDCLSAADHPQARTPHLDALAARGVRFARHFANAAPCAPAGASLYTGLHQMNHRVCGNGTPLDARHDNVALAARRAGYLPVLFGHTDVAPDPRGLDPHDPALRSYEGVLPGFETRLPLTDGEQQWLARLAERGIALPPENPHRAAAGVDDPPRGLPSVYGREHSPIVFVVDDPARQACRLEQAEALLGWRAEHLDQSLALGQLASDGGWRVASRHPSPPVVDER